MLDVCPRCRIQAAHRPGRQRCPRCGGPLQVAESDAHAAAVANAPATPIQAPPPPVTTPTVYRSRHVRWVARRPWDTIAPPPRPRPQISRRIPRYVSIPRWGLIDQPNLGDPVHETTRLGSVLTRALQVCGALLAVSAAAHLLQYVLLVVNRTVVLPTWLAVLSTAVVIVAGCAAIGAVVASAVIFARWILLARAQVYREAGFVDPRRRWATVCLAVIPLVNIYGALVLMHELVAVSTEGSADRRAHRVRVLWVAWVLVNTVAVVAAASWCVAAGSGSIQTAANTMVAVICSAVVSCAFAFWSARRIPAVVDTIGAGDAERLPEQRWVMAA